LQKILFQAQLEITIAENKLLIMMKTLNLAITNVINPGNLENHLIRNTGSLIEKKEMYSMC
jgi:hypothetical protein